MNFSALGIWENSKIYSLIFYYFYCYYYYYFSLDSEPWNCPELGFGAPRILQIHPPFPNGKPGSGAAHPLSLIFIKNGILGSFFPPQIFELWENPKGSAELQWEFWECKSPLISQEIHPSGMGKSLLQVGLSTSIPIQDYPRI